MTKMAILRIIIAICFISANLFLVSGAGAVTENECINGGGAVSEGSGCKFCVGGKYDLSEVTEKGKNNTSRSGAGQKTNETPATKSGTDSDTKPPADSKM
jgi:hypothetical protein